jgi:hypothetical protein
MQSWKYSPDETAERGITLYHEIIRPRLTPEDDGKFIVVNLDTGEFVMDADNVTARRRAREQFGPDSKRLTMVAGDIAVVTFGFHRPLTKAVCRPS